MKHFIISGTRNDVSAVLTYHAAIHLRSYQLLLLTAAVTIRLSLGWVFGGFTQINPLGFFGYVTGCRDPDRNTVSSCAR